MRYYFKLQFLRIIRKCKELGIHPIPGLGLVVFSFFLFSIYLFYKTEYAHWMYLGLAVYIISELGGQKRKDLLSLLFRKKELQTIRILENLFFTFPFAGFLVYKSFYIEGLGLLLLSFLMSFVSFRMPSSRVIPTPFKRRPFEFIVAFRKGFWLLPISGFLLLKSIQVDNYNLGVFSIFILLSLIIFGYSKPETEYHVWIYSCNVKTFLLQKIGIAIINTLLLTVLSVVVLIVCFPDRVIYTLGALVVAIIIVLVVLLGKYSAYPKEMNLPQALLIGLCFWVPPMVFFVLPIFYIQASKKLNLYLYD
jgi:hypothetical protein